MTLDRAASHEHDGTIPSIYLAWCVNMGLINRQVQVTYGGDIVALKLRQVDCREFFTRVAASELRASMLTERGLQFTYTWYEAFKQYASSDIEFDTVDAWTNYDIAAKWLTARLFERRFRKPWWQFWRARG